MKHLIFLTLILFGCTRNDNNIPVNKENETTILKPIRIKAMTNEIMEEDTVHGEIGDRYYTLYPDGKIAVEQSNQTDTFHLDTKQVIETAYFFDYKNDLIIYYTETDAETGASFIECYDRKTNKLKWKNDISAFNLSEPIIVNNLTYVASIGFIGKLNLDNGKYLWKHDGLYEKTKFNSFDSIGINDGKVYFIESIYVNETKKPGRIIIDDKTGKITRIIKNVP